MLNQIKKIFSSQHYGIIGENSAIQVCRWTKKSLLNEGFCYKEKFYGIKSHLCCQMSPNLLNCPNKCIHCWRPIEITKKTSKFDTSKPLIFDKPEKIIKGCIKTQRKMLTGFKGNAKVNLKKWKDAQNPQQFAISLIGEPTQYPYLSNLIKILRKQNKTTFLVTNGLYPENLKKLEKEKTLPTQLYISLNTPNKKLYDKWHNSEMKNAWEKFNKSLELMNKLKNKTRRVIRMTLVKDLNMLEEESYSKLIKKANPDFIEAKAYMSVGFARQRLDYEKMPSHHEVKSFAKKLLKHLREYKFLDEKKESRVVLLGKNKSRMKIRPAEI